MAALPPLPDRTQLADLCREAAAAERVEPQLVEKDFYLTRLLWALGEEFGEELLLKGGTLLSKVDLGFFRMSEDADLVIPGEPSRFRNANVRRMNRVRDALRQLSPSVGVAARFPGPKANPAGVEARNSPSVGVAARFPGGELLNRAEHCMWDLRYESEFGAQRIKMEVSIRPVAQPARRVKLAQLLSDPLAGDYSGATCHALSADEARAEKVRAAFTRAAIRDYYDLARLLDARADLTSDEFVLLVDRKLAELGAPPLREQPPSFGLDARRLELLRGAVGTELRAVLRADAPTFALEATLRRFDKLWRK
jgi:predicted nucleotidyltransferase component of viral defense system